MAIGSSLVVVSLMAFLLPPAKSHQQTRLVGQTT